jgi:hypothetical protein
LSNRKIENGNTTPVFTGVFLCEEHYFIAGFLYTKTKFLNTPARMTGRTGIKRMNLIFAEICEKLKFFLKNINIGRHEFSQSAPPMRGVKKLPAAAGFGFTISGLVSRN